MTTSHDRQFLFTIGKSDECIFQWSIRTAAANWELDYLPFESISGYQDQAKAFHNMFEIQSQMIQDRKEISSLKASNPEISDCSVKLKLRSVIGRKAASGTNQLLITVDNRLITTVGSVLMTAKLPLFGSKLDSFTELDQAIIEPDCQTMFSESPEIISITICQKGRLVAVGTKQIDASIIIWDVTTNSFIKKVQIVGVYMIKIIRYCKDAKRMVALCSQQIDNNQSVYYIDVEKATILGFCNFMYSHPDRIQALDFLPDSNYKFITCGIQHICQWEFKGSVLTFHEFPMVKVKDFMKYIKANEQLEMMDGNNEENSVQHESAPIRATFLCLLFINSFIILGAEDGEVFLTL